MTPAERKTNEIRLRRKAQSAIDAGLWNEAQAAFEELSRQQPENLTLAIQLADLMLQRGQLRAATRKLFSAVPALPDDVRQIIDLAWRLATNGEVIGARACADHLERAPNPPGWVLAEQAHLRWTLGEIPAAKARMDRAVAAGIDTKMHYYLHGMLLQFTGHFAGAERVLLELLERWPDHGDAAVILANLRRQTSTENHSPFLHECLARLPPHAGDMAKALNQAKFESAIFKTLDDLGRYDEAWQALERSNALMHAFLPYDAAAESALTDALLGVLPKLENAQAAHRAPDGPMPIFIIGLPRSGTTLLDRMLSAHSSVTSAGEINDFHRHLHWVADVTPRGSQSLLSILQRAELLDFRQLGARYLAQAQWRAAGHRYFIDKLPINVRMVPFIRRALPNAHILNLTREPMDVCYANLKMMFGRASPYCYDMQALAHYHRQYTRLISRWHAAMPGAVMDVPYAELVTAPASTMKRVLAHCGLDVEAACLHPERNAAAVATPSASQVREPLHARSLAQWKRYERQLEPLRRALAAPSDAD